MLLGPRGSRSANAGDVMFLGVFIVYIEHISRRGHQAAVAEGVGGVWRHQQQVEDDHDSPEQGEERLPWHSPARYIRIQPCYTWTMLLSLLWKTIKQRNKHAIQIQRKERNKQNKQVKCRQTHDNMYSLDNPKKSSFFGIFVVFTLNLSFLCLSMLLGSWKARSFISSKLEDLSNFVWNSLMVKSGETLNQWTCFLVN